MPQFPSSVAGTLRGGKGDIETLGLVLEGREFGGIQEKDQIILVRNK